MYGKRIFIFGGSGSLGNALIKRYSNNEIVNFSRDECKHWKMEMKYNNIENIIGDIRDHKSVATALIRKNPHVIIIAAALKHIDRCEFASEQCIATNINGTKNITDAIETHSDKLTNLETVVFVSTDKACSPINTYGMSKAISEKIMIEKSHYIKNIKFVVVRYGNVLNSRGSIIPILHEYGNSDGSFNLTHPNMTRFIMTLEESCELIEYAILKGQTGEIIIPKLRAMYIKDLFSIFSELYQKDINIVGIRPGEKMNESLINETQSRRVVTDGIYHHIRPNYLREKLNEAIFEYHSGQNVLTEAELYKYLVDVNLIKPRVTLSLDNVTQESYLNSKPYPHCVIDNALPTCFAEVIRSEILDIPSKDYDRYHNVFEDKFTLRDKNNFPPMVMKLYDYLVSDTWLEKLSDLAGIQLINDPDRNFWGIHIFEDGDKLDMHVDAGEYHKNGLKKEVTLGIYLSSKWKDEYGGELEIWEGESGENMDAKLIKCHTKITPDFNRMVIFSCTDNSWHGAPTPVKCPEDATRIFLTISYLSNRSDHKNKKQKAFFVKRPEDPEDLEKQHLARLRADPKTCSNIYNNTDVQINTM